jgi:hypothetical protein
MLESLRPDREGIMRSVIFLQSVAVFAALLVLPGHAHSQQSSAPASPSQTLSTPDTASLRVCLRLEDETPFRGFSDVRVMTSDGREIQNVAAASDGELFYTGVPIGSYVVEAVAPGFLPVRIATTLESAHQQRSLFVVLLPKELATPIDPGSLALSKKTTAAPAAVSSWLPAPVDDAIPAADPNTECPLQHILKGVGQRMTQFVSNMEKFTATERVEHSHVDSKGVRRPVDMRSFAYVVAISQNPHELFVLDEFRDGTADPGKFPARIATNGLPAIALIFHPLLAGDFKFECEGLGHWKGKSAWQVHFLQRPDKPSRIRAYVIDGRIYHIPLKGRVWIDPGTFQIVHLDSELVAPNKKIQLTHERCSIDYALVEFHSEKQEIWLPQTAELWVERNGHRFYRRHSFSDFKVFSVDTTQSAQKAKESYTFTNTSDRDLLGVLTVKPAMGSQLDPVTISFTIPAGGSILKLVGPGKDVNVPVGEIASATFVHNGKPEAIKVDAHLLKESSLDVIPDIANPSIP